jgi:hypothetical protein
VPVHILICGSRDWSHPAPIRMVILGFAAAFDEVTVIHGDAPGADRIAGEVAAGSGLEVLAFPAKWEAHDCDGAGSVRCWCSPGQVRCRAAGVRRNQQMLDEARPDVVYAFRSTPSSNGTNDMISRARKAGLPVYVVERVI